MSAIFNLIELKFLRTLYPSLKLHLLFNSNGLQIWHDFTVIKHNKSQKWPQVSHLKFDQVDISNGISLPETAHFVR